MTAAAAAAAVAEQAALPGVKPQTPARPPHPDTLARQLEHGSALKAAFMGRLAEPARVVDDPAREGRALLQLVLQQQVPRHPQCWPLVAVWHVTCAQGHALSRAHALAAAFTQGTDVVVLGRGVEASHHAGEPCLRVLHVLDVKAEHLARAPHPETQAAEEARLC